jgi:uncharacterized protein (TIGR00725 family)
LTPAAPYVAIVGASNANDEQRREAEAAGRRLAELGAIVVTGGRGGVMEAACRGAKAGGGQTLGILPTADRGDANEFVDVAIPTGMGEMRNALVVRSADALVAIGGAWGTLSEVALALHAGKPVFGVRSFELGDDAIVAVASGAEAAERAVAGAQTLK